MSNAPSLMPWVKMMYSVFSKHHFDFYIGAHRSDEIDSEIYFRNTEPTWKRRAEIATVVFPIYTGPVEFRSTERFRDKLSEVFCLVRGSRQKRFDHINFREPNIELAMLKTDILATENGYDIFDAFNFSILQKDN